MYNGINRFDYCGGTRLGHNGPKGTFKLDVYGKGKYLFEILVDNLKANYNAHTWRCQHAYDTEREYIEAAISMGIEIFGFSDHVPCPYQDGYVSNIRMTMKQAPEYVETIRRLEAEYRDQIKIYAGFEAEYVPEFYEEQMRMFRNLGCDYMIMGQHFLGSEEKPRKTKSGAF